MTRLLKEDLCIFKYPRGSTPIRTWGLQKIQEPKFLFSVMKSKSFFPKGKMKVEFGGTKQFPALPTGALER